MSLKAANPDTQDLPERVASRTNFLLQEASFGLEGPNPEKHFIYAVWLE